MDNDKTQIKLIRNLIEDAQSKKPYIIIISGKDSGKELPLYSGKIIIGRNNSADVTLDDQNISRKHSQITLKNNKIIIKDLNSTNGTFVNGNKITETSLKDGDLIYIGDSVLKVVFQHDIEKNLQEELYNSAITDVLTGLFSKRYFLSKIESEFIRSIRYKRDLSIIIFDLDDFKKINDTHGHLIGDMVLKITAQHVKNIIRDADTLARFGGEEFVIILPETTLEDAKNLANKIKISFHKNPFEADDKIVKVTASIGIAAKTKDTKSWKDLLVRADQKLYLAKNNGKDRICF
ncbi:MAG: GGDEF domain-containing protein [bacterium]